MKELKGMIRKNQRLMVFLVPATDIVSGGLMSICNIARCSRKMQDLHSCEVVLATVPGSSTISRFTQFNNQEFIYRFEQIEKMIPQLEEIYFHIPDICCEDFYHYLLDNGQQFKEVNKSCLNVLNQNNDLMPETEIIRGFLPFFDLVTQTCAHEKYCTKEYRDLYGVPMHLLPADIPTTFYPLPYEQKDNLVAYSNDKHPLKESILTYLKNELPEYTFIMIENMTFEEYKRTIGRAKWTLSFGEGWDGYFFQPYLSDSIGLCVFQENFCPEYMKTFPTVFPNFETLGEHLVELIKATDTKDTYLTLLKKMQGILLLPEEERRKREEENPALAEFYKGKYTFP